jgi:uncharacterized DUF497 family protein
LITVQHGHGGDKLPVFFTKRQIYVVMEFEWYSEKERLIAEEHGLDMEAVKRIFDDPFRIVQYDDIRIITAREATPEERQIYYGTSNEGYWFIP